MTSPGMFIVGFLLIMAGIVLWLLAMITESNAAKREQERREQTPFNAADGHPQTQKLRREWGL